jgi:hypothetical protein
MMTRLCFSCFVFLTIIASSAESKDLQYVFREIEKPIVHLSAADQVVVLSPRRAGSTLTYMIFQYLFEDTLEVRESFSKKIVKTHNVKTCSSYYDTHPNTYLVIPIRNPRETFLSKLKALDSLKLLPSQEKFINQLLSSHIKEHLEIWDFIQKHQKKKLLLLRYEDFHSDLAKLLTIIENNFEISLSDEEKHKIYTLFSKEAILEVCKQYPHFAKQDPITGLHGQHIQKSNVQLEDYVSSDMLEQVNNELKGILHMYGYN